MRPEDLKPEYYHFGNKGDCWGNKTHIAGGDVRATTLCGTPMLSSNWAKLYKHEVIGCKKCIKIYNEKTQE